MRYNGQRCLLAAAPGVKVWHLRNCNKGSNFSKLADQWRLAEPHTRFKLGTVGEVGTPLVEDPLIG